MKVNYEEAKEWWDSLTTDEQAELYFDYGLMGHDEGINSDDILWMYKSENGL